jgi:hypothetical protein
MFEKEMLDKVVVKSRNRGCFHILDYLVVKNILKKGVFCMSTYSGEPELCSGEWFKACCIRMYKNSGLYNGEM